VKRPVSIIAPSLSRKAKSLFGRSMSAGPNTSVISKKIRNPMTSLQYLWMARAGNVRNMHGTSRSKQAPALQKRLFYTRLNRHRPARLRQIQLDGATAIAKHFARAIPLEATHCIVAQSLLPALWQSGVLGGRTFDVLMTRLPLQELQTRLDTAFALFPDLATLNDFRTDPDLGSSEAKALEAARTIITPHQEIARLFPAKTDLLEWSVSPGPQLSYKEVPRILFPGPTVARKGAYEIREAACMLNLEVLLMGSELEGESFWSGIRTRRVRRDELSSLPILAVVLSSIVEDTPRLLLAALAAGVPVVTTPGCGLAAQKNLHFVPPHDPIALTQILQQI
jgi:hypothetical protein